MEAAMATVRSLSKLGSKANDCLAQYVQELIEQAPTLTSDQTQTIARILGGR